MKKLGLVVMMVLFVAVAGCANPDTYEVGEIARDTTEAAKADAPAQCAIRCIAPPPGCTYKGGKTSGACNSVTCGKLVCDKKFVPECCISCAAPPEGCRYEGMVGCGPCDQVTCGSLVCDGALP